MFKELEPIDMPQLTLLLFFSQTAFSHAPIPPTISIKSSERGGLKWAGPVCWLIPPECFDQEIAVHNEYLVVETTLSVDRDDESKSGFIRTAHLVDKVTSTRPILAALVENGIELEVSNDPKGDVLYISFGDQYEGD
jgi:hypothetical protein